MIDANRAGFHGTRQVHKQPDATQTDSNMKRMSVITITMVSVMDAKEVRATGVGHGRMRLKKNLLMRLVDANLFRND